MKVYCKNCKWNRRSGLCDIAIRKSKELFLKKNEMKPGVIIPINDEFDDCYAYKRKWWKVWAK